ncbi:hypothetical protein F4553_004845 [Allocatelliglobosispora scoriae]|uniref:DUF5667 domain-containing protein n=1 Tax=Allocatelliglobosispora scoriae TaxID=643052 RepID=A0A841BVH2_9ACTN|nr:DUF5667 domain-containing protein [Allocatelliglobosispora scoriae]MBB5871466.1 hypothetical protein [Allocatelliglobosispora scoriae]
MNTIFDRRRAERFAQLIDEVQGGRRHHTRSRIDEQLTELVTVGQQLGSVPLPGGVRPDFRRDLRAQLMATAEREGIGITAVDPEPDHLPTRPSRARIAIFSGVAVGALAISSMSVASGDANPGDTLYGFKRSTERAQLALASSDLGRGQLYLEFARTRVGEAHAVRTDSLGLVSALGDMDADTLQGVKLLLGSAVDRRDASTLTTVDKFVEDQRYLVRQLGVGVDSTSAERVNVSLSLLTAIGNRSHGLRTALSCGAGSTGAVDSIGPIAAACSTAEVTESKNTPSVPGTAPTKPQTAPSAGTAASPGATPAASTAPQPSPAPTEEGGLLDGLGRILGDLLGG